MRGWARFGGIVLLLIGMAAVAAAASPGVWPPIELSTAGTFPRSVQRLRGAGTDDLIVFANGSDLAPAPLTGFCLDPDAPGGGAGGWLPAWSSHTALYDFGTAVGDIDGDGHHDLVVASLADVTQAFETGGVRVHYGRAAAEGDGCGALLDPVPVWLVGGPRGGGYSVGGVELADLDFDGDLDIVVGVLWWAPPEGRIGGAPAPEPRERPARERSILSARSQMVNLLPGMRGADDDAPDFEQTCSPGTAGFQNNLLRCMNGRPRVLRNAGQGRGRVAFEEADWAPDVSGVGGDDSRLGASAMIIRDLDGDGFLDLFLGSQQWHVFLGKPDGTLLSTTPAWSGDPKYGAMPVGGEEPSSRYIYDLDYLPAAAGNDFLVASTACIMPEGCDLDANGFATLRIDPTSTAGLVQTGVVSAGLWVGSDEFAAAVGVGNVDGDGVADLIGGTWSSMNGTQLSGGPALFLPGTADGDPSRDPIEDDNPNTLPGAAPLPMAADIQVDRYCGTDAPERRSVVLKPEGTGPRAVFELGERGAQVVGVHRVLLKRARNLVTEVCPMHAKTPACEHVDFVSHDRSWLSISPPLSPDDHKRLTIEYDVDTTPDVLVANSNPTANSALWCHQ